MLYARRRLGKMLLSISRFLKQKFHKKRRERACIFVPSCWRRSCNYATFAHTQTDESYVSSTVMTKPAILPRFGSWCLWNFYSFLFKKTSTQKWMTWKYLSSILTFSFFRGGRMSSRMMTLWGIIIVMIYHLVMRHAIITKPTSFSRARPFVIAMQRGQQE